MLEVSLHDVSARGLRGMSVTFARGVHTAVIGPPGAGASTLLQVIAGSLHPQAGEVRIGARVVNEMKPAVRPLLFITSELDVPRRWSVQHALIAAVRTRTLDRVDRQREYDLAVEKWRLEPERKIGTLSGTEQTLVQLARIELLRPGILLADRVLERLNPSATVAVADDFYRTLRVIGTTVISAPASRAELALTDAVVVLSGGRVVQIGTPAAVYGRPADEAAAVASGEVNRVPVTIRGRTVESAIGAWEVDGPPFQGSGIALARPEDFAVALPGEDSDFVFGVEEAGFGDGRWLARGVLTGGVILRVALPAGTPLHKGRLLALRYDPTRFRLLAP
ncbi:MAG TPA: ATP-binding cassette domain-containing protein [Thermoanaerobaculia bacterium]|nr:ATP-binding cassette domain-containing protein [Thermoanaerobaculia bacterium]